MGDIAEMDISIWEQGGIPDGTYGRRFRPSAKYRWKRGFDYVKNRPYQYLVDKFLVNMVGMKMPDALKAVRQYCEEMGFEAPNKKPYGHMAVFIQKDFGSFKKWIERYTKKTNT